MEIFESAHHQASDRSYQSQLNLPHTGELKSNGLKESPKSVLSDVFMAEEQNRWYAIYTRSRFEKKLHRALCKSGIKSFLPLVREKRRWSDRMKTVEVPLIPGYVFVNIPTTGISEIYNYPGFVRVVSFEGKPCEVRKQEIELLYRIIRHDFQVQNTYNYSTGDNVKIVRGPLRGWEGRIEGLRGKSSVQIYLECIGQFISVEINKSYLEQSHNPG